MRHFFIRYQAFNDNYEGFFFDAFSAGYWHSPQSALKRYLRDLKKKYDLSDGDIDVLQLNRL